RVVRSFQGHTTWVKAVAVSPDGRLALSGTGSEYNVGGKQSYEDCTVRLWDVASGQERHCFPGHTKPVTAGAFSAGGRRGLSLGEDHTVRVWDLASGEQVACHEKIFPSGGRKGVFSPGGRFLLGSVTIKNEKLVRLWDLSQDPPRVVFSYRGVPSFVRDLAISADSRFALLASGGHRPEGGKQVPTDCSVRLIDLADGRELGRTEAHSAWV